MTIAVSHLTIDCADPHTLSQWWCDVLGWSYVWPPSADDEEIGIDPPEGGATGWLFIKVPDAKVVKNRLHVDLRPANGSDQATELERLLSLGATRVDIGQQDVLWHVLADPEGNEFCLLRRTPEQAAAALAEELAALAEG